MIVSFCNSVHIFIIPRLFLVNYLLIDKELLPLIDIFSFVDNGICQRVSLPASLYKILWAYLWGMDSCFLSNHNHEIHYVFSWEPYHSHKCHMPVQIIYTDSSKVLECMRCAHYHENYSMQMSVALWKWCESESESVCNSRKCMYVLD